MINVEGIRTRYQALLHVVDERVRRLALAAEAMAIGRGGQALVARVLGVSPRTIRQGMRDLSHPEQGVEKGRIRRVGGGRKRTVEHDPSLREDLEKLVEPTTRGDPESPLRWTCKSVRKLAEELRRQGHLTSHRIVAELLHELGYSLQANRKTLEGSGHPDRNAQFMHLNQAVQLQLALGQPVISVDTKKKELVGPFKNSGRELRPTGQPEEVLVHDFLIPGLGRVSPYGVYDVAQNQAWVSVGVDHDTAAFAVESIRRWWRSMGQPLYPKAHRLLITADAGGSNGYRLRLWKLELQKLADETGLEMAVCHFPPGTSKWNKIEHRLFSYISANWRGRPLTSLVTIVNLIAATRTETGLRVRAEIDKGTYPQGLEITEVLVRSGAVDVVVIDSVAALVPRAEIDGEMGDSLPGMQARIMSQALRKLPAAISKSRTCVVFINQLREKIGVMFGNPETTTGGRALKFYASVRLDIRRISAIKDGEENIGSRVKVKVVKNKVAPPFREAEFDIIYGEGISRLGSLVDLGVAHKVVDKSGAWYAYGGERIGQGRENAKRFLQENLAVADEIETKLRTALGMVVPTETEV